MKNYLIVGLIVLANYFSYANSQATNATIEQTRAELLQRSRYLTTLVTGEVKLLTLEGRALEAQGLTLELETLVELELEVRASANITRELLMNLEERLRQVENRLAGILRSIGREFVRLQEIQQLILRAEQLLTRAGETVKRLRARNRTVEATGLEAEEAQLIVLEIELRSTQNSTELRRLEERLVETEYRLWELLNGVDGRRRKRAVRPKRHHKEAVVAEAKELIASADSAIKVFQQENRTNAVTLIQTTRTRIQELLNELNNVTNVVQEDEVVRLEEAILVAGYQLAEDLRRLGRPLDVNERKDFLVTGATFLSDKVALDIAALKAQNRSGELRLLEEEGRVIDNLVAQLKNATTAAEMDRLEALLLEAEGRLYDELERLGQPVVARDELERLLRRAEELAIKIVIEVRRLTASGGSILIINGLLEEERTLVRLDAQLRTAVTPQQIVAVEQQLNTVEIRVNQELTRIG